MSPAAVFAGHQVLGIDEELGPGGGVEGHHPEFVGGQLVEDVGREVGVGVGDEGITLFHQPGEVLFRQAHDPAQHAHRQFAGDFFRGVKGFLLEGRVEDAGAEVADGLLERGDYGLGEGLGDLDPGHHVLGRVGFLEGAAGEVFLVALILHPDAAGGGQKVGLAVEAVDVVVPGD